MSTRNPAARVARRRWARPAVRAAMWGVSGALVVVTAAAFALEDGWPESWWAYAAPPLALLSALATASTDANTRETERRAAYPLAFLLRTLGLWLLCAGAGAGVALALRRSASQLPAALAVPVAMTIIGLALFALAVPARARAMAHIRRTRSVQLTGPQSRGVVTGVRPSRLHNVFDFSRVTVRFDDSRGRTRWHTVTVWATPAVGTRCWVRYDPERPGRRSPLFVDWKKT